MGFSGIFLLWKIKICHTAFSNQVLDKALFTELSMAKRRFHLASSFFFSWSTFMCLCSICRRHFILSHSYFWPADQKQCRFLVYAEMVTWACWTSYLAQGLEATRTSPK
ncbi:unnamed protein product [Amoebophrya sp. A120]|nr:unnamed protein product [Amoebophrya sp. A120]|eukprot:GSA120T00016841001.1